jgi:hypothetical protein
MGGAIRGVGWARARVVEGWVAVGGVGLLVAVYTVAVRFRGFRGFLGMSREGWGLRHWCLDKRRMARWFARPAGFSIMRTARAVTGVIASISRRRRPRSRPWAGSARASRSLVMAPGTRDPELLAGDLLGEYHRLRASARYDRGLAIARLCLPEREHFPQGMWFQAIAEHVSGGSATSAGPGGPRRGQDEQVRDPATLNRMGAFL